MFSLNDVAFVVVYAIVIVRVMLAFHPELLASVVCFLLKYH